MKENDDSLKETKEDFRTLNEDLSLLKQAYTQLENAFKGVYLTHLYTVSCLITHIPSVGHLHISK